MSNMFIYFRFTFLGVAGVPTLSQPDFPTGQELILVICQFKIGMKLMISLLLVMGAQGWVIFPLCRPSAAPFLEALGILLEILIFVGFFLTTTVSSLLMVASLAFLATSCSSTVLLLVAAAARLLKYCFI